MVHNLTLTRQAAGDQRLAAAAEAEHVAAMARASDEAAANGRIASEPAATSTDMAPAAAREAETSAAASTADAASEIPEVRRAAAIESETPDMPVRVSDDGARTTAAEEMAAIRREVAEGTDAELGTMDADLVRVAAECALSIGPQ
jgi:hypothetical protein